ncbi:hypothetical protein M4D70_25485 [Brevibacillus borstelensis]|uniref:hypothetical protein n=1 Tax=Brevibacillus borstelensis TaxID=45462 RepID=UPI00203C892F|nr:hypothetical protein [Brevibacillus borstelensis]MCM3625534.1 hypothetical protein [Brevibacillus borstelensis]
MNTVQEAYEELVLREDQVILKIKTSEWAVSIFMDELLYRQRGNTCAETIKDLCERIREQEESHRKELFNIRWEKTLLACQFPNAKKQAEVSDT